MERIKLLGPANSVSSREEIPQRLLCAAVISCSRLCTLDEGTKRLLGGSVVLIVEVVCVLPHSALSLLAVKASSEQRVSSCVRSILKVQWREKN